MSLFRPLWQLLLDTVTSTSLSAGVTHTPTPLTCGDCFSILEYLADLNQENGDTPSLIQKARQHLVTCPDCHTYYQQRLDELEAKLEDNE